MAEQALSQFPDYVTDGHHIYLWHPEYESMLGDGRLRPSGPPELPKVRKLNQRELTKVEALRQKALKDAQDTVKLLEAAKASGQDLTELFGEPPKDAP